MPPSISDTHPEEKYRWAHGGVRIALSSIPTGAQTLGSPHPKVCCILRVASSPTHIERPPTHPVAPFLSVVPSVCCVSCAVVVACQVCCVSRVARCASRCIPWEAAAKHSLGPRSLCLLLVPCVLPAGCFVSRVMRVACSPPASGDGVPERDTWSTPLGWPATCRSGFPPRRCAGELLGVFARVFGLAVFRVSLSFAGPSVA